jgi:hypothetical protein
MSPLHKQHSVSRANTYNYRLATASVEAFVEKYARVTIFMAKKLEFPVWKFKENLKTLFMYYNVRWNVVRETMKYLEKQNLVPYLSQYTKDEFLEYLTTVKSLVVDDLLKS